MQSGVCKSVLNVHNCATVWIKKKVKTKYRTKYKTKCTNKNITTTVLQTNNSRNVQNEKPVRNLHEYSDTDLPSLNQIKKERNGEYILCLLSSKFRVFHLKTKTYKQGDSHKQRRYKF